MWKVCSTRQFMGLGVVFIVAINLLVWSLVYQGLNKSYAVYESRVYTTGDNVAYLLSEKIKTELEKVELSILALEDFVDRQMATGGINKPLLNQQIANLASRLESLDGIRMTDATGTVRYGTNVREDVQVNIFQDPHFSYLMTHPDVGTVISKPKFGGISKKWTIKVVRRYNNADGSFAGVMSGIVDLAHFTRAFSKIDLMQHDTIILRDKDLSFIARYPVPANVDNLYGKNNVTQDFAARFLSNPESGKYESTSPIDGQHRMVQYRKVGQWPLLVQVSLSKNDHFADWYADLKKGIFFSVCFTIISVLLSVFVYRNWGRHEAAEQKVLLESEKLAVLMRAANDGMHVIDMEGNLLSANDAFYRMLGYTPGDPALRSVSQWDTRVTEDEFRKEAIEFQDRKNFLFETTHRHRDGTTLNVEINASAIIVEGRPVFYCSSRDITSRMRAEEAVRKSHEDYVALLETTSNGFWRADSSGAILEVNGAYCKMSGYTKEELLKMHIWDVELTETAEDVRAHMQKVHDLGSSHFETMHRRKDGSTLYLDITITSRGEHTGQIMAFMRDIGEKKEHQKALEHIAFFDVLTGLPNRRLLSDRLNQAIAHVDRSGEKLALCYLDLDGFKPVNDKHGHELGDRLLARIAEKLKRILRAEDTIARLGGDEFVMLFADLGSVDEVQYILDRALAVIREPVNIDGVTIGISGSVGVTLYPDDKSDPDTLLRHADQAMYAAKRAGDCYRFFDQEQDFRLQERFFFQQSLRQALSNHELQLYYQPKVDMLTGKIISAEALIRWQHPTKGFLLPGAFLHYLEGSELEVAVGEWVIKSVLKQLSLWETNGLSIAASLNVSAGHLLHPDFTERLSEMFIDHPEVRHDKLSVEILETAALSDMARASAALSRCRELGINLMLDDFGTGYSSLTYFRNLPIQTLKIDKSFIFNMLHDPSDLEIVISVMQLAKAFRRNVIAEGVETMAHAQKLVELGCRFMQGFGIARPMPADEMAEWVSRWQQERLWEQMNLH